MQNIVCVYFIFEFAFCKKNFTNINKLMMVVGYQLSVVSYQR